MSGICQQCGRVANLHYCKGCGKWVCSSPACNMKSAVESVLKRIRK
jgi:hypothetical protein